MPVVLVRRMRPRDMWDAAGDEEDEPVVGVDGEGKDEKRRPGGRAGTCLNA